MRHTLLPLNERRVHHREYYFRVAIVLCFMISLATLIGITSLFPIYIRSLFIEDEANIAAKSMEKGPADEEIKNIQKSVAQSLALLTSLGDDQNGRKMSELVNGVVSMRNNVKFTSFTATKVSTTTFTMSIQGISPTRNSLLSFKSNFESLSPDNKVNLPVSELAKSTDLKFTLQLNEKLP